MTSDTFHIKVLGLCVEMRVMFKLFSDCLQTHFMIRNSNWWNHVVNSTYCGKKVSILQKICLYKLLYMKLEHYYVFIYVLLSFLPPVFFANFIWKKKTSIAWCVNTVNNMTFSAGRKIHPTIEKAHENQPATSQWGKNTFRLRTSVRSLSM